MHCVYIVYKQVNKIFVSQFKRPRMLILGCGDIGKRIINEKPNFWRFFYTNTNNLNLDNKLEDNNCYLKLKLQKLAKLSKYNIYTIAPQNHNDGTSTIDQRIQKTTQFLLYLKMRKAKLIYISTTGVYGAHDCANLVHEYSVLNTQNNRSKRRIYAEQYLRKTKLNISIARVPGIYTKQKAFAMYGDNTSEPKLILNQQDDVYTNHIHADDLARCLSLMLFKAKNQRIINIVDNSRIKSGDYNELIANKLNLPSYLIPQRVSKQQLMLSTSAYRMSFLNESKIVSNLRLIHELQFTFRYADVYVGLGE
jgi:nucleoside-diphosphate-sugar epimerase